MTTDTDLLTVEAVSQMPDESWVNTGVTAHVCRIETIAKKAPKTGNFWKASLSDGGSQPLASLSLFTAPKFSEGDRLRITGSGIKKTSWQGNAQLSIGKDTKVEVAAGGPRIQQAVQHAKDAHAQQQNEGLINGPTAGMGIKTALDLLTKHLTTGELTSALKSPAFWGTAHEVASDIIRLQQLLEKGKLAPPIRERAPQGQRRQETVEEELDSKENVPF